MSKKGKPIEGVHLEHFPFAQYVAELEYQMMEHSPGAEDTGAASDPERSAAQWARDALEEAMSDLGRSVYEHTTLLRHATARLLTDLKGHPDTSLPLRHRKGLLEVVGFAATCLLKGPTLEAHIGAVLEHLGRTLEVSRVAIFKNMALPGAAVERPAASCRYVWVAPEYQCDTDRARQRTAFPQGSRHPDHHMSLLSALPRWAETLRTGHPLSGRRAAFSLEEQAVLEAHGIYATALFPIVARQQVWWGWLALDDYSCERERAWSSAELEALAIIAVLIGAALARDHGQDELQKHYALLREAYQQHDAWVATLEQRIHDMTIINAMGAHLQRCMTSDEAYLVIMQCMASLFAQQAGVLYRVCGSGERVEVVARWGEPPPALQGFAPEICMALQHRRPCLIEAGQSTACCCPERATAPEPFHAFCIPLIAHGKTVGLLHLRHTAPLAAAARERWHQVATTIADHMALALTNLHMRERLQYQSIRDALTGLFNRRYLEETLSREISQAERHNRTIGIIMIDIDHFKHFNDTYGHHAGDAVLQAVGNFLNRVIRGGDIACRYGGEEFLLILPEASLEHTHKRAEQVCQGVRRLQLHYQDQILPSITFSLGVASFPAYGTTGEAIIRAADHALYQAKASGRDCVVVARLP
jgi:diguanylate cyclase (GGDEF)-like protein